MRRASGILSLVPSDSVLQSMSEEERKDWLRSLSQETLEALNRDLEEMFEVRQPKFSQDSHYSEESESSGEVPSLDNSVALPFSYGEDFTRNKRPFRETNPEHSQGERREPSTGITGTTAKNKKQKMCSKYSFVIDEREWILEQFETERDSLRKEGKEGTVEQIAPRIYNKLYVYGRMGNDKRVKAIFRLIDEKTRKNPNRKVADVDVVRTAINNRTHRKKRCYSTPHLFCV